MKRRNTLTAVILLIYVISMATPVLAAFPEYVAICADSPAGYNDFTPHYQYKDYDSEPHFPPGSTVYVYVEETGKTVQDIKTGQFSPSLGFSMVVTGPLGYTTSSSTSSSVRINDAKTLTKKTFAVLSYGIPGDAVEGKYKIKITVTDSYDGGKIIAKSPYIYFQVKKNANLYPPYEYTYDDLSITPNPAKLGQTVTVSVNVTNIGGRGDLKGEDVILLYDGKNLTTNLHLVDDETKKVEFKLSKNELDAVGTYNFAIGDLNGALVLEEQEPPSGTSSNGGGGDAARRTEAPGFTTVYMIAAIAIVIYLMSRRNG